MLGTPTETRICSPTWLCGGWMKPSTGGSSVPGGVWLASMVEVSSPRAATRAMSCSAMPAAASAPEDPVSEQATAVRQGHHVLNDVGAG